MAKELKHQDTYDRHYYYYDSHPTREDLMGETIEHADLVHYLRDVLRWQFRERLYGIYDNLNFYQTNDRMEYPLAPDIAVIKGASLRSGRSWRVDQTGPAPLVVFEFLSDETWANDLKKKPEKYAQMGVREYFAYDPNEPPVRKRIKRRLWGWSLDRTTDQMLEMPLRLDGSLWSPLLESYLVSEAPYLRLYDNQWQRRLTEAEAKDVLAQEETRRAETEAEARRIAQKEAEMEAEARRIAERQAQLLAEKLRSLGIDPDQL